MLIRFITSSFLSPSSFSPLFSSMLPVWKVPGSTIAQTWGEAVEGFQTLPTPLSHTHTHLSRAKFHQEALLAWLTHSHCCPASPGMFPFPSGPLRWGPGGAGGAFLDQPPYSEPTHPGYLPAMWRACWKRGKAVQRKGEPCALAMLISLVRPWLNPVGICHCCQETRRSLFIIKGFALL